MNVNNSQFQGNRTYPDPFDNYASKLTPETINEAFRWGETFWFRNGTYAMALTRAAAYFLTDLEIQDVSDDVSDNYDRVLSQYLKVFKNLLVSAKGRMCYGNAFNSLYVPFKRLLINKKYGIQYPINKVKFTYDGAKITWKCPIKGNRCEMTRPKDLNVRDETRLKIIHWSPYEIHLKHHPISQDSEYYWDPPADIITKIKQCDPFYYEYFPWEMIEAIMANKKFKFAPGVVYHMKNETLAGVNVRGWGISEFIPHFNQAYYVQMAKLMNEVLMNEYIVPFRVVSPARVGDVDSDPMLSTSLTDYQSKLLSMLDDHRRNPGGWHTLPFPVEYQSLGAEGAQLSAYDHIAAAQDELLNASGVPAELFKGTLQFQALPSALRIFQQTWIHLVDEYNDWLQWVAERVSTVMNWDKPTIKLARITLADDIERNQVMLQLMGAGSVSPQTALRPYGIDAIEELGRQYDWQRTSNEKEEEFAREMEMKQLLEQQFSGQQMAGMLPGGSMAQGMGMNNTVAGNTPITPGDLQAQAEQIAMQLVSIPYEQRRTELLNIKKTNPTLHAIVKQKMEEVRQNAASEGKMMLQAPPGGPMGMM